MKHYKYLFTLVILFSAQAFLAQSLSDNENSRAHRRYWYYRTRFINDFVKLGKQQGDGIAFAQRNFNYEANTINSANPGPDQIDLTNMYLSTLALEYKILRRNNQETKETISEIYYLLETINRLDLEAEYLWSNSSSYNLSPSGLLNGFILREDMNPNYVANNVEHFNYALKEYDFDPNTNSIQSYTGLEKISTVGDEGKFIKYLNTPSYDKKREVSLVHDKYYSMLAALMFIVKYIPASETYVDGYGNLNKFSDGESSIKQEAINIANRIHPYIKGNTFANTPINDWVLKQPDGSNIGFFNGAGATFYSFSAARMICHVNQGFPWAWGDLCTGYQDPTSLTLGFNSYKLLSKTPQPQLDQAVFIAWNQAGTNYPSFPSLIGAPVPVIPCNVAMKFNTGAWSLEWAELMRRVLFQSGELLRPKSVYTDPIKKAPCNGPYNFGYGIQCDYPDWEWSSQDRTEHPDSRGSGCSVNNGAFYGNYPGIDYMFLHNLYYEYLNQEDDGPGSENGAYQNAINLMDNYDEKVWPRKEGFITYGVSSPVNYTLLQPANVKVFQNLKSRAQIYASVSPAAPGNTYPSKVEYRAGKDITLLPDTLGQPGFEVKLGSDFHAYIQRYVCSNGDYGSGLRQNSNNGGVTYSNDYETDEMNTDVAIHYVEHPLSDSDLNPYTREETVNVPANYLEEMQKSLLEQYNAANDNKDYGKLSQLENEAKQQRFMVLPNPNNGVFKVFANKVNEREEFTIYIYDMSGRQVGLYEHLNTNISLDIDLSNNGKGIYIVNISSNMGYKNSKKVNVL